MEQGGGGGGESAAKHESSGDVAAAAGEDRLSALPDDLLVLILLKLGCTRAAARTSVLSHRWRRIWALLPNLFFRPAVPHRLRDVLDAHEVLIRDLYVWLSDGTTPESPAVWLPAAARRVYSRLGLIVFDHGGEEQDAQSGALEFPCFEMAASILLALAFQRLAVPPTGVFTRLIELFMGGVWFHGPGDLGDAVSSPRCPCLQRLTVEGARGLGALSIHSESMLQLNLRKLHALSQLTVVAPVLKELTVEMCFVTSAPVANISAPQLTNLHWNDKYDPTSVHLGKMEHLCSLRTGNYLVYAEIFLDNDNCLSLLQRFENIETLSLPLMYQPDIEDYQYMMEDMVVLPYITCLDLMVVANGHAFEASAFHVLRLSTGIRRLVLQLDAIPSEAQAVCSSDCMCIQQPTDWETEELSLNHLEEVKISGWRGTEHEVALMKRLFDWRTKLKEMTVDFHCSISEVKAKELYQIFQSFSKPGVCMKFYLYFNKLYAPKD